jgi:hypothetical protein
MPKVAVKLVEELPLMMVSIEGRIIIPLTVATARLLVSPALDQIFPL